MVSAMREGRTTNALVLRSDVLLSPSKAVGYAKTCQKAATVCIRRVSGVSPAIFARALRETIVNLHRFMLASQTDGRRVPGTCLK
jgi:hypothetical protein